MSGDQEEPATTKKEPTRDMLPQYRKAVHDRLMEEIRSVKRLTDGILDISKKPKEEDISEDLSVADLLKPKKKPD